jgi:hypothetical protein
VRDYGVTVNLTLPVDERIVRRARKAAESIFLSLNQAVRRLGRRAGSDTRERDVEELEPLSSRAGGRSRGWRFDRDEAHERRP